jgi:hypothetical protein
MKFTTEVRLSVGAVGLSSAMAEESAMTAGSSEVEFRGLLELPRRLSNAASARLPTEELEEVPSSDVPTSRVRSANSGPIGASSGLELRSVPRVRPIPALEEDMRRKSIGFASAGTWLKLVGCELFVE